MVDSGMDKSHEHLYKSKKIHSFVPTLILGHLVQSFSLAMYLLGKHAY